MSFLGQDIMVHFPTYIKHVVEELKKNVQVIMKEQICYSLFPIKLRYLYLLNEEVLEAWLLSLFTPLLVWILQSNQQYSWLNSQ